MKKASRKWLFALLAATLFATSTDLSAADSTLPDSLVTIDQVYEYTFTDFGRAQQIMEVLRKKQDEPQYELDTAEGDLYYNTGHFYQALRFYRQALESKQVQEDTKKCMELIHRMISCYDSVHNEAKKAQHVKLLLRKAKECGDEAMQAVALFHIGRMLYYEGNKKRGREYMWQATEQMARTDYKYKYDNLRYNYNMLLVFLEGDKRSEEALRTLNTLEKVVREHDTNAVRMNGLDEKEQKSFLAHRAVILCKLGRISEADACYSQFLAMGEFTAQDNYVIIAYLFMRGLYDEVIRLQEANQQTLIEQGDTVNHFMTTIKKNAWKRLP